MKYKLILDVTDTDKWTNRMLITDELKIGHARTVGCDLVKMLNKVSKEVDLKFTFYDAEVEEDA